MNVENGTIIFDCEIRDIPDYEGRYAATADGHIWSYLTNKYLHERRDKDGYLRTNLTTKNGKSKTYQIHRLVAAAWISNPTGLPQVNHKDENKENNHYTNLEWCSAKYNINYGLRNEKMAQSKRKPVRCVETGEVFPSIKAAAEAMGVYPDTISSAVRGKTKTCRKLHWEFAETAKN